jgi:CRISPR-associated protein Cas2
MRVIVAYDVATSEENGTRRLRRVAKTCESFGVRVQKSLFECQLGPVQWVKLRHTLLAAIDLSSDSLRFYYIDEDASKKTEHHGANAPTDPTGPLVF